MFQRNLIIFEESRKIAVNFFFTVGWSETKQKCMMSVCVFRDVELQDIDRLQLPDFRQGRELLRLGHPTLNKPKTGKYRLKSLQ